MNPSPEIKSGVNERLKEACPNLDLSQAPPINQKRLVTFINHFLINIVEYLNTFAGHCTNKFIQFDQQLNRLEAELCLLESKLNSIPELADQKDVNVDLPKPELLETKSTEKTQLEHAASNSNEEVKETPPKEEEVDGTTTKEEEPEKPEVPDNPELIKYRKMIQVGVPIEAVKIKMQIEGLDPSLLGSS